MTDDLQEKRIEAAAQKIWEWYRHEYDAKPWADLDEIDRSAERVEAREVLAAADEAVQPEVERLKAENVELRVENERLRGFLDEATRWMRAQARVRLQEQIRRLPVSRSYRVPVPAAEQDLERIAEIRREAGLEEDD